MPQLKERADSLDVSRKWLRRIYHSRSALPVVMGERYSYENQWQADGTAKQSMPFKLGMDLRP
jgi:hypothetical protein